MAHVFGAVQVRPKSKRTAVRARSHNGGTSRVATDPRGLDVRGDMPGTNTREILLQYVSKDLQGGRLFWWDQGTGVDPTQPNP